MLDRERPKAAPTRGAASYAVLDAAPSGLPRTVRGSLLPSGARRNDWPSEAGKRGVPRFQAPSTKRYACGYRLRRCLQHPYLPTRRLPDEESHMPTEPLSFAIGRLPYASEVFGTYRPMVGWASKRKRDRIISDDLNSLAPARSCCRCTPAATCIPVRSRAGASSASTSAASLA